MLIVSRKETWAERKAGSGALRHICIIVIRTALYTEKKHGKVSLSGHRFFSNIFNLPPILIISTILSKENSMALGLITWQSNKQPYNLNINKTCFLPQRSSQVNKQENVLIIINETMSSYENLWSIYWLVIFPLQGSKFSILIPSSGCLQRNRRFGVEYLWGLLDYAKQFLAQIKGQSNSEQLHSLFL